MKTVLALSMALFIGTMSTSFTTHSNPNKKTTIHWVSKEYTDLSTNKTVIMLNEFVCKSNSINWSLFGRELVASAVEWNVDNELMGTIKYVVDDPEVHGTILINMTEGYAQVSLNGEVGQIYYNLKLDSLTTKSE